jgi:ketosteroid isomerase-like protein
MTNDSRTHDPSIQALVPSGGELTDDIARHAEVFAAAFNSGDPDAVDRLYEERGVFVPEPGQQPVTGAERHRSNAAFQALGLPIQVSQRHAYVAEDVALLIVDWKIEGTGPDGAEVNLAGTATDVARRGPDGRWRYLIDNPFGIA